MTFSLFFLSRIDVPAFRATHPFGMCLQSRAAQLPPGKAFPSQSTLYRDAIYTPKRCLLCIPYCGRDSSKIEAMSDEGIFELTLKAKGRMIGEGDRDSAETAWELVNYIRTFGKKDAAAVPKPGLHGELRGGDRFLQGAQKKL